MDDKFQAAAQMQPYPPRDELIGALVGLARTTYSEQKSEDTDDVLARGLRLAADSSADASALERMTAAVHAEKLRIAPNCASCVMRCGNTDDYDMSRLWGAAQEIIALKLRLLCGLFALSELRLCAEITEAICRGLFALAEDWDAELLQQVVLSAEDVMRRQTAGQ